MVRRHFIITSANERRNASIGMGIIAMVMIMMIKEMMVMAIIAIAIKT